MKISYLFSQFPLPTEAFAVSDIAALRDLGHQVAVHTIKLSRTNEKSRARASNVPEDLEIYRTSLTRAWRWPLLLWRWRRQTLRLVRKGTSAIFAEPVSAIASLLCIPRILEIVEEISANESEVVHLFWSRHAAHVLYVLKDIAAPQLRSAFVGAYDLVADDFLVQTAMKSAQVIFSHSEANRSYLDRKCPPDLPSHVIHRGIPLMPISPEKWRDPNLWLTASALVKAKNVEAVVDAFARCHAHRPELRLIVCGDGPERARLERRSKELGCADVIQFLGHVDRRKVFDLLAQATLFLLLSTKASERLPNVIKEAMWSGCAIVASQTEGIEELVLDEGIGMIVDPCDTAGVDRAVLYVLDESDKAAEERKIRARALITNWFSSKSSMARYVSVWQDLRRNQTGAENWRKGT